ncbi:MAG TPA: hypothetical protein VMN77_11660 [Nitrospiria bacterium]|jgi:hypothetical protein|nr:hypothetical protein [Nitrospiria bacterium]
MNETGKEKLFLDLAAELTRFYTLLSKSLQPAAGEKAVEQFAPDQFSEQLRQIWASLRPHLEKNAIVKDKLEKDLHEALRISSEYEKRGPKGRKDAVLKKEAARLMEEGRLKASGFSDLVALFRRL